MRTKPWTVGDELWGRIEPLILPAPSHAKGRRPCMPDRQAFAIVYVLRTRIQWNALPCELGASSTVHDRFRESGEAGFLRKLWEADQTEYDQLQEIGWRWQVRDGAMTKAPFGTATATNPTGRGKCGVKRSLLTNGAGILLAATLDGLVIARPARTEDAPQALYLDTDYDYDSARNEVVTRGYRAHIRSRRQERATKIAQPRAKAGLWVVERTHSWLNRALRLLVPWEKRQENYLDFPHLACAPNSLSARSRSSDKQ